MEAVGATQTLICIQYYTLVKSARTLNITIELPVVVTRILAVLPTLCISCSWHGVVAARLTTERLGSDLPL